MPGSPHSCDVPMQPAAVDLLNDLGPVLGRWGRWYVFGAQAVVLYGVPRLSADVGVTLALAPDVPEKFVADMDAAGFAARVTDPEFVRRTRVLPFVHRRSGMPLDIVLAGSGLEEEFLSRAVATPVGETRVPVIDISDLIIAKVLAGRPKDLQDVAALWRIHRGRADTTRIRHVLGLLEEALSQSDLLSAFERIAQER